MRTRLILLCICVVSTLYCVAQPNNNCSNAVVITQLDGTCVTGNDNTGANEDIASFACTAGSNNNVWFRFTAIGTSAEITVNSAIGTPEITVVQFPGAPCDPGNALEIDCAAATTLTLDNQLVVGTVYYVMVAFSNNGQGLFDICIDNPVPATNDACITSQVVSVLDGTCQPYNNDFPSTDVLIPSCFTGSTYNVWYSFTAVGVSLEVNIPAGGPGPAQFAVIDFTGSNCNVTGAIELGCATGNNTIVLDNQLVIGTQYHVVVGFSNSDFNGTGIGDFELCINNPIPAPNDPCSGAINIPSNILDEDTQCFTSISGNPLNNDWPSTDVGEFSCWNPDDSYNIWYSFVAQGPDVQITVDPVFNADAQIALVEFTGSPCQLQGAIALECANGTILDFNDQLIIGNTYYIAVGFENNAVGDFCMNVFNPEPPPNDEPCDAIALPTNGNCNDYTTIYANPENWAVPNACQSAISNTVWYTLSMADPDNVGYEIQLDLDDVTPGMDVSVILWEITDCNQPGNIVNFYCGDPPTDPIEFGPVDETVTYYLSVGTSEPTETDFEICVDEIPPCFTNDICEEATVIPDVFSDSPFSCIPGCNLYADPELFNNPCGVGDFSTVWFQVNTDGNAALMNIQVNSDDFDAPTITLFHLVGDCSNLELVPLTTSNLPCIVGSNGEAEAFGSDVGANAVYFIAVSSLNNIGGDFEICVNTISAASLCVTSRDIQITGRSSGGPLTGPFFPGETVSVCMNVNSYTAANNGCQWFQGLIPVFGNGWDPSSFDANGQPLGATVNGNAIGVAGNGIYGASTWDWFQDVDYHYNHVFYQLGDFDNNGTTDMCNLLYDPDCPNTGGLTGGCCNPCWGAPLGTILPGGWFAYGINGSCATPGPPVRVDWGDGNTCGAGMGPWSFCFDLNVRPYPECLEDMTTMDLSLGFFTTADGETGAWTGNASICALDQPAKLTLPMCCTELDSDNEMLDPICSGSQFVYVIDQPDVDFWQWTVEPTLVSGATSGQGGPGTLVINTLTNTTGGPEEVVYNFLGFAGGACPVFEMEVTIIVYPQIEVILDPLVLCATPTTPYVIAPEVTGGTGMYGYTWSPGGESTPTITVANPVNGTQYIVSVFDDVGCFHSASMSISVYETFPVDIVAPIVEQCLQDGPLDLGGTATGGFEPYEYLWTLPDATTNNAQDITSDLTGEFLLEVTDSEGCKGKDSVDLLFNESPEVFIDALNDMLALCEGESTQLTGQASLGEAPYYYEWTTPEGLESGKTITATYPGQYTVTVTDANGCTAESDLAVEEQPSPDPELDAETLVCNFDNDVIISVTEQFDDYIWSTGPGDDGEQIIDVFQPGTYTVTVTNEFGCTGEEEITIGTYPQPNFPFPDTFEICSGSSITLDADDYGGPWDAIIWYNCGNCNGVFNSQGAYSVQVTDENGCTSRVDFEVLETASLDPGLTGDNIICTGETITLTALTGFQDYTWSANAGGATGNTATVTSPGTYMVTVGDNAGCSGVDSVVITSGDITTTILGPTQICAGVQATLNAGGPFASYLWSTGQSINPIQVEEGTHSVTVTSTDGCSASASITIVETPFIPVITGDDMICQTSETTTLNAGAGVSYVWSANAGSAITQTVTLSTAGIYEVTVTDAQGCVGTDSQIVGNHPVPFVAVTGNPDFCVGGDTQLDATPGFTYSWSTIEATPSITVNTAGNYVVTVTDANGCTNTASATVNPPYQETVEITGSFVFCPGDQATLEVPAGYSSVLWSTGETTDQITTSFEGIITVTVIDPDGCIATDDVTTDENATLSPVISGDDAICDAGSAVLNAGSGFDNYVWSANAGGAITQMVTVNAPGTYTVTVSSNSGCMGTDDFVVVGQTSPTINLTNTATACNVQEPGGPTTSINFNSLISGSGGAWAQSSGPSSVNLGNLTNVNFDGLSAGSYVFTFTTNTAVDPCVDISEDLTVTITDCACPFIDVSAAQDLCNDDGTLDLALLVIDPTDPDGDWNIDSEPTGNNPATLTGNIFDATGADVGTYVLSYTLTGLPSYCTSVVTTPVNVIRTPDAGSAATPASYCEGETQTISLATLLQNADGGGQWVETSQNMSTGSAFNATAGTFNVVAQAAGKYTFEYVVNGNGPCPDDVTTVEVIIDANPVADAGTPVTLDCTTSTTVLGGPATSDGTEFSYTWSFTTGGVLSDVNIKNPIAGAGATYTLTVMNNLTGCTSTDQVVIDQNGDFPTDVTLQIQSPDCEGDAPGSAQVITVVGGTAPYSYVLNGAAPVTVGNFTNLPAGDYDLEITDAAGCKLNEEFTIEELVVVDLSIVNYVNDTLIYAFGDTIKLSFLFSGTSDTPDSVVWRLNDSIICINCPVVEFVADQAGQISLQAFDVRGCEIEQSITFLVVRDRDIYIPNVFSPNGDGINDFFTAFTDNDIVITGMEIYTRWGDLVFRSPGTFLPNSKDGSWDGNFRGERLNPGVYVYRIELLHGDGLEEKLAGDVTLVR